MTMEAHMARFRVPAGAASEAGPTGAGMAGAGTADAAVAATTSVAPTNTTVPTLVTAPPPPAPAPPTRDSTLAGDRIIACERCRCYKKKCSKTPPACTACVAAGRPCSLASAVPTSLRGLRARLAWLEQFIERRELLGSKVLMSQVSTGTDLDAMANAALAAALASPPGVATATATAAKRTRDDGQDDDRNPEGSPARPASTARPMPKRTRTGPDDDVDVSANPNLDVPRSPRPSYIPPSLQQTTDPWMREALVLVDAYFRDVNRSYPFLDRRWVYAVLAQRGHDVRAVASPSPSPSPSSASSAVVADPGIDVLAVYLVMAIGRTTLQRTGKLPPDGVSAAGVTTTTKDASSSSSTSSAAAAAASPGPLTHWRPVSYDAVLALALREDETADVVQLLLLLALYSLYNSCAPSTRPIVDVLARLAVRLGLTQRHRADDSLPPAVTERNRRIVWCIYVLDGMVCLATGLPPLFEDDASIDLPLPSITVDEFASPDRPEHTTTLQATRQLVDMAKLQHAVLRTVRARQSSASADGAGSSAGTVPTRSHDTPSPPAEVSGPGTGTSNGPPGLPTIHALRTAIEDWYSNGCLLRSHAEADDLRIHVTIPWLAARYYNILMLLYFPTTGPAYPSPVVAASSEGNSSSNGNGQRDSHVRPASLSPELLSLAQKHVQANAIRFQQRQIPLNHLTLCCIFPVLFIFFHHIQAHRPGDAPLAFQPELDVCADMMAAYPAVWPHAHRGAALARQLSAFVAATSSPARAWPPTASDRAWLRSVRQSLVELAQQVLGHGSAYRLIQDADGDAGNGGGSGVGGGDDNYYSSSSYYPPYPDDVPDAANNDLDTVSSVTSGSNPVMRPLGGSGSLHHNHNLNLNHNNHNHNNLPGSLTGPLPPPHPPPQASVASVTSVPSVPSVASSAPTTPYTDDAARAFGFSGLGSSLDQASPTAEYPFVGLL